MKILAGLYQGGRPSRDLQFVRGRLPSEKLTIVET